MKLSVLGFWQPTPSQPVPGPVHIMKLVSVFLSVISIGALRSAPLMTIFDVSAFANNSAGIASRRRMYKTESTRFFTARTHFCLKLDHPRLDRSIYGSAVVTRWDEKAGVRRDAVRSQVIDALEAQKIKETGNE